MFGNCWRFFLKLFDDFDFDNCFVCLGDVFFIEVLFDFIVELCLVVVSFVVLVLFDLLVEISDEVLFVELFGGYKLWLEVELWVMVYFGYQFGFYNLCLGDGCGLLFGEVINQVGEYWDLYFKGVGQIFYLWMGDGCVVLCLLICEFFVFEVFLVLGIFSSWVFCVIGLSMLVWCEKKESVVMLLCLVFSYVCFGYFEYFYYICQYDQLKQLVVFVLEYYFVDCNVVEWLYVVMFCQVVECNVEFIVCWQVYGFCYGVMNIDNMLIFGIIFDYGFYVFFDDFDVNYICNYFDDVGCYFFSNQVLIVYWNLVVLVQVLMLLVEVDELCVSFDLFLFFYQVYYFDLMCWCLGLGVVVENDYVLVQELLQCMQGSVVDYLLFFC